MVAADLLKDNPLWIVDVGASQGIDARWERLTRHFNAVLFEPDPREFEILRNRCSNNMVVLNAALSDTPEKEISFHLCHKQQVSSVYRPNMNFLARFPDAERYQVQKSIRLVADTLDNQLKKNDIADIDFIKIDTQGHELAILHGSQGTLRQTIGLELEVEFAPLYEEQPLFDEVDRYVRQQGFELFDLKRYFWKRHNQYGGGTHRGQLIFGDALYFAVPEKIMSDPNITKNKLIRAFYVYLVYGYVDLAQSLLDRASEKKIIAGQEQDAMQHLLVTYRSETRIPRFRGKGRIRTLLLKIASLFEDNHWCSGGDTALGN